MCQGRCVQVPGKRTVKLLPPRPRPLWNNDPAPLNSVGCTSKVLSLVNHGNSQIETQKKETRVIGVFAWEQHLKWKETLKAATNTPPKMNFTTFKFGEKILAGTKKILYFTLHVRAQLISNKAIQCSLSETWYWTTVYPFQRSPAKLLSYTIHKNEF